MDIKYFKHTIINPIWNFEEVCLFACFQVLLLIFVFSYFILLSYFSQNVPLYFDGGQLFLMHSISQKGSQKKYRFRPLIICEFLLSDQTIYWLGFFAMLDVWDFSIGKPKNWIGRSVHVPFFGFFFVVFGGFFEEGSEVLRPLTNECHHSSLHRFFLCFKHLHFSSFWH